MYVSADTLSAKSLRVGAFQHVPSFVKAIVFQKPPAGPATAPFTLGSFDVPEGGEWLGEVIAQKSTGAFITASGLIELELTQSRDGGAPEPSFDAGADALDILGSLWSGDGLQGQDRLPGTVLRFAPGTYTISGLITGDEPAWVAGEAEYELHILFTRVPK